MSKTIRIGIPETSYSLSKTWEGFMIFLFDKNDIEVVSLNPDLGKNDLPDNIDLVIFDGGADVHPILYGGKYDPSIQVNLQRDWNEKIIFDYYAKSLDTVFAGICRGSQFLNVMMGGTLYEDLPSVNMGHTHMHDVEIVNGDSFAYAVNKNKGDILRVNSLHHQAVKDLGAGLVDVLRDTEYGVIEGFQSIDGRIRAVQSHPEMDSPKYNERIEVCDWLFRTKEF